MSSSLGKLFTTLFMTCCCFVTLGVAQSDAIILGKIDSPLSRIVRFEYKRNHFSLEEGSFEAILDTNNVFAVRIKLNEPRAIFCTHHERAVKLFVAPGDTLKMRFNSNNMLNSINFDGNAAAHNDYLIGSQKQFPDWLNENTLVTARLAKNSRDYLTYVDSIFLEKRRYFDRYDPDAKALFTNDFLEFATNDINYWRAYELMLYVKTYGFNNTDPNRMIDDSYFNFTLETDNIYFKALNNEYYLQYLELYLGYLANKNGLGQKEPTEIIEERSRYVKTVKPIGRNLRVIEEPYLPRDVVSWLAPNEEAVYQNLLTGEKFKYVGEDSTYDDIFLKIRTNDGKTGWVPQSAITIYEKTIIERTVHNRFCFQPEDALCGFDKHLSGKVLYFTVAKDILYSLVYDKIEVIDNRIKQFTNRNIDHKEYNTLLKTAYDLTIKDRSKGINRLNIPPSCDFEEFWKDRVYYARNLRKLKKDNPTTTFPDEVVIDYTINNSTKSNITTKTSSQSIAESKKVEKKVESTPQNTAASEESQKEDKTVIESTPQNTVTSEESQKEDKTVIESTPQNTVTSKESPKEDKAVVGSTPQNTVTSEESKKEDKTVVESTPRNTVASEESKKEDKTVVESTSQNTVNPEESKKVDNKVGSTPQNTVASEESKKVESPSPTVVSNKTETTTAESDNTPLVKNQSKTNYANQPSVNFSVGDDKRKIEFNIPTGFMISEEYDPSGKPLIFKGMVINESVTPFEFTDIDKNVIRQQDLMGKVVVLSFWATWCGPCKPTMEYTQRLANKYSDKDVVFIYISADFDEATWREYLKEHKLKGIQGIDDNQLIRINLRIQGLPNYFVIDKKGRVAHNSIIQSKLNAEEWIDMLLKTP